MTVDDQLEQCFAEVVDGPGSSLLAELFGTSDTATIAETVSAHVSASVAPPNDVRFVHPGVGLVVGLDLEDGRGAVLKVHRWHVSVDGLAAVQTVQRELADRGLPAPRPLAAPARLGRGLATLEELRAGDRADGHDPRVRRSVAAGLARFISAASRITPMPSVGRGSLAPVGGALWTEPHDLRFDFERTASGAEWIDDLARRARATLTALELPDVVAHFDWRVENLGFRGSEIVAVYDWDSVALAPEPVAVGQAAAAFSTDWGTGHSTLPSVAEMRSFVADYAVERGRTFATEERAALDAANLLLCAYSARCEHSDQRLRPELVPPPEQGWRALLRRRATEPLLSPAVIR